MATWFHEKGFTLIEVMMVVAIIGVLAAIAIPQFQSYRRRAQDAAAKTALHQLAKAQEDYYLEYNTYKANQANINTSTGWTVEPAVVVNILAANTTSWSAVASHSSSPNNWTYSSSSRGLQ